MVICFSASQDAKNALDELMSSGQFKDVSEAVSMALMNYQVIQKAVESKGHVVVQTDQATESLSTNQPVRDAATPRPIGSTPPPRIAAIPELFGARHISLDASNLIQMQEIAPGNSLAIAPKDWLWGQYNRFFPIKATCRGMLRLLADHPNGVPVDETTSRISYAACSLGDYLFEMDSRLFRRRDEAMAAAFPTTAISGAQGRVRFGTQFVGTLKQGKLIGFPAGLQLLGCDFAKEPRLLLTTQGAAFAALANPVLDNQQEFATHTLSDEEIQFLLDHVRRFVPEEISAYVAVIDAVDGGANTPDGLDSYLRERFRLQDDAAMKPSFLATQRTGAVSRMVELGLLAREKEGLRVTYVLTHPGKCFRSQIA